MSRLLLLNIVSIILIGLTQSAIQAQVVSLTKKEIKVIKKQVRKMTFDEKVKSFVLTDNDQYVLADLDTIDEFKGLPLPSAEAISQSVAAVPEWLPEYLGADFIFNSNSKLGGAVLGLDSAGRILEVNRYYLEEEIVEAFLRHDFIIPVSKEGESWLTEIRFSQAGRRLLNSKVELSLAAKHDVAHPKSNPDILDQEYRDWVIKVYASNKQLHETMSESKKADFDFSQVPDQNWLSKMISRLVSEGVYNEEGQRLMLAKGNTALFDLDLKSIESIDTLIDHAIEAEAMPGCQLLIAKDGYVILEKAYGYQTYDSLQKVSENTIYDLASLTKVLATTQALMLLTEAGKFDPARKLSDYLPYLLGTNKENIIGIEVLSHQADLYPYYPFWKKARDEFMLDKMNGSVQAGSKLRVETWVADSILSWAAKSDMLSERSDTVTQRQYFYSDVGFYFFEDLIQRLAGKPLDMFLKESLYDPAEIKLVFNPLRVYADSVIAPTEMDKLLRNELVRGYVHDRNAALMGGVAGQAGLFGNASNVASLMQIQLDEGSYNGIQFFSTEIMNEYTKRHFTKNRRGLGWDMPALPADRPALPAGRPGTEPDGPVSAYASEETFGHTGFTGGMVWADPKENLIFVFLSNRVYPSVDNNKLIEMNIRTRIQDLVYQALGYQ